MPHQNLGTIWGRGVLSPAKFVLNGAQVGFTDFSEFDIQSGVPAGITQFALGTTSTPTVMAIANDPAEGRYFSMNGVVSIGNGWGFGLDAFNLCISFGELLARIYTNSNFPIQRTIGPGMNLGGLVGGGGGDFNGEGGGTLIKSGADFSDPHSIGSQIEGGFEAQPLPTAPFQEPWQQGEWAWQRVRVTDAGGGDSDWEIKTWYGAFEDEPSALDGFSVGDPQAVIPRPAAIGWFVIPRPAAGFEQRIAYLSFSSDPLLAPPPPPGSRVPTDWTPS